MASRIPDRDLAPVLAAARQWMNSCLVGDNAMLTSASIWSAALISEVREAFLGNMDAGPDDFLTKLKRQMHGVSPDGQCLMAEMLWILLLFPSNIRPDTKRDQVLAMWELSGRSLVLDTPLLSDDVLDGIGSGGPGFNNHRWRELAFLLDLTTDVKARTSEERQELLSDYTAFLQWMEQVPQTGHRQFRHMFRYFAFPDRVERMSSNGHRRAVLAAFQIAEPGLTRHWTDRELDEALLNLRQRLEEEYPNRILDFYNEPLRARWRTQRTEDPEDPEETLDHVTTVAETARPALEQAGRGADNLILYGPPGTGKTHWLQAKMREYTDAPAAADRDTWLQELVGRHGWRSVLAAALFQLGRPARVPEIRDHTVTRAKARQRGRSPGSARATIWGFLQEHTPPDVATVNVATRRPPYIFTKSTEGDWSLTADWRELDEESAEFVRLLGQGPEGSGEPVRRYRAVTFHPSFGYEDFVRGIRPVASGETGTAEFTVVDGLFKQICDEARANPARRYALFIDEINRANIAKVFGELITLIEPNKRATFDVDGRPVAGMTVHLAGGADLGEPAFGVPDNLDIYGTMNTADRSIALLDVALRRRFRFRELEPDYSLLDRQVGRIHLGTLLRRLNDRLEYFLDRDRRIGHGYLMPVSSIADLRAVFADQLIPLLQEFFFDDFAKVSLVLATSAETSPFIRQERLGYSDLFSRSGGSGEIERARYRVTAAQAWSEDSFLGLYDATEASVIDVQPA